MRRITLLFVLTLSAGSVVLAGRLPGDPAASEDVGDFLKPAQSAADEGDDIGKTVGGMAVAMGDIAGDLGRQKTDAPLQTKQKHVADSLDVMIKALEQACNGNGGGSMNPTQGAKKSTLAGGPGGMGDLRDARAGEKQWGALKPKAREQILQAQTDGFPSGYESLLQSYYRRLSSEETVPAATGNNGPTTQPGAARP
ncbi:MAG TPA: hypothetical protein VF595_14375 [Tepidisphaeraceae bacterium]|jgi:hypothetical protein